MTFLKPQPQLAQYLPQASDTDVQMPALLQLLLQRSQGQLWLRLQPYS